MRAEAGAFAAGAWALLAASCASVDWDAAKEPSYALDPRTDTSLSRFVAELPEHRPEEAAFYLLSNSLEAFSARLLLADAAERTLDVQYYILHADATGALFLGSLIQAADRGVRVRLLLDDFNAGGLDEGLAGLDAHPSCEVRMWNPFAHREWRSLDMVGDTWRIDRRMHNKSMTADNQASIIGGRNIGEEYFGRRLDWNFGDLDVLGFGPFAHEVSASFDDYWNHRLAVPIDALFDGGGSAAEAALVELRRWIEEEVATERASEYGRALLTTVDELVDGGGGDLVLAPYAFSVDPPDKSLTDRSKDLVFIGEDLRRAVVEAERSLFVISPYFVPQEQGTDWLVGLEERGIEVTILTNSLASNDNPAVHAGYAPHRERLLSGGVELFEMRTDVEMPARSEFKLGRSGSSLHAKAFVVDDRGLFVGSFNWDPRSARTNTELGVLIRDMALSSAVLDGLREGLPRLAYQVVLTEGGLRWVDSSGPEPVLLDDEPGAGFWRRTAADVLEWVPIDEWL